MMRKRRRTRMRRRVGRERRKSWRRNTKRNTDRSSVDLRHLFCVPCSGVNLSFVW
jgi:hypothetical protein